MSELSKAVSEFITADFVLGGIFGALSFLFGILVKHVISMREEMIKRELEMRKEEKEFFMELYGHIATMTDLVNGLKRASQSGKTRILKEDGFKETEETEIVSIFQNCYLSFSKFMFSSRNKGYEVFFPKNFADNMAIYSGYLDAVYEIHKVSDDIYASFQKIALKITANIESMLGV